MATNLSFAAPTLVRQWLRPNAHHPYATKSYVRRLDCTQAVAIPQVPHPDRSVPTSANQEVRTDARYADDGIAVPRKCLDAFAFKRVPNLERVLAVSANDFVVGQTAT